MDLLGCLTRMSQPIKSSATGPSSSSSKPPLPASSQSRPTLKNSKTSSELETAAIAELLKEAARGSARAEVGGSLAWKNPPKINRRLFKATLAQAVVTNTRKEVTKKRSLADVEETNKKKK